MATDSTTEVRGTYLFDGPTSRRGHAMNKLFMSLRAESSRTDFRRDQAAYCRRFGLSESQSTAILNRDWPAMLELGGNIFYIYKLARMDGLSMQYLGGIFTGMSEADFTAAMLAGGRTDG